MADQQAGHKRGAAGSAGGGLESKRMRTDDGDSTKSHDADSANKSVLDGSRDEFCWLCHREGNTAVHCIRCPRVYHARCLASSNSAPTTGNAPASANVSASATSSVNEQPIEASSNVTTAASNIVCVECERMEEAHRVATTSLAMRDFPPERFSKLLLYVVEYLKDQALPEFKAPVDITKVRDYRTYIVNPLDLGTIEQRIRSHVYSNSTMFHCDMKWLVHNSMVYNGSSHRLTKNAKHLEKLTRQEMLEIEMCPDCYARFTDGLRESSFSESCAVPHVLVWARMRGYPFWPAKVMRETDHHVDVRFFGDHERAQVAMSAVQLLSKLIPVPKGQRTEQFQASCQELLIHVKRLRAKYGYFEYAPPETMYTREKAAYFREVLTDASLRNRYEELFPAGATPAQQASALPPSLRVAAIKSPVIGASVAKSSSRVNVNDTTNESVSQNNTVNQFSQDNVPDDTDVKTTTKKRSGGPLSYAARSRANANAHAAANDRFDLRPATASQSRSQTSLASVSPKATSNSADLILKKLKGNNAPLKTSDDSFPTERSPSPHCTTIVEPNATDFANDEEGEEAVPEKRNEREYDEGENEQEEEATYTPSRATRERGGSGAASAAYFFQKLQRTIAACQEFGIDSQQRTVDDSLTVMDFDDETEKRDKPVSGGEPAPTVDAASNLAQTETERYRRAAIQRERIDLLRLVNGLFDTLLFVDDCGVKNSTKRQTGRHGDLLATNCEQSAATDVVSSSAVEIALRERNEELANENAALRALHGQIKLELIRLMHTALSELQADTHQRAKQHVESMRRQIEVECAAKIEANKRKQWCAHCLKEATLYCCWNVAYCSYACQRMNWPQHMNSCQQVAPSKQPPQIGSGNSGRNAPATTVHQSMAAVAEFAPKVISVGTNRSQYQSSHQLVLPAPQQTSRVGNVQMNPVPPIPRYGLVSQPGRSGSGPSNSALVQPNSYVSPAVQNMIVRSSNSSRSGGNNGAIGRSQQNLSDTNLSLMEMVSPQNSGLVLAAMRASNNQLSNAGLASASGADKNA